MKKIFFALMVLFCTLPLAAFNDDGTPISFSELPQQAQQFVNKYFYKSEVKSVTKEMDDGRFEYTVRLNDLTEIEFNHEGDWKEIGGDIDLTFADYLPENLVAYMTSKVSGRVSRIEKDDGKIEVSVGGVEYVFSKSGKFRYIDD